MKKTCAGQRGYPDADDHLQCGLLIIMTRYTMKMKLQASEATKMPMITCKAGYNQHAHNEEEGFSIQLLLIFESERKTVLWCRCTETLLSTLSSKCR